MKDLIKELEQFHTITNMLCTNTQYSFNNYWPMKVLIENMLSRTVDVKSISHIRTIKEFRGIMLSHFKTFELSEKTTRLAKTASMLDPIHMIRVEDEEIIPFADHVVQILEKDVPHACATETQMVGPSQDPVSLEVNIPKAQDKDNVSQPKSKYAALLNPKYELVSKKTTKSNQQARVHQPLKEIVMLEVT